MDGQYLSGADQVKAVTGFVPESIGKVLCGAWGVRVLRLTDPST
jgi:hypothetical protein